MTAPKIYRYDDDNAPALSGLAGSGIALLRACLVDGYGAKQPAGWTMPYCNAAGTLAAFRNNPNTGTGFYLQADNADNVVTMQGYENMTDEATGLFPFHNVSTMGFYSSETRNDERMPWILFADDRFFMVVVWSCATSAFAAAMSDVNAPISYPQLFFFGDCIPLSDSDHYFCVIDGETSSPFSTSYALCVTASSVASKGVLFAARNMAGVNALTPCALVVGGGPLNFTDEGVNQISPNFPPRTPGHEIVSRPYINDGTAYSMRGYAPGIWHACHKAADLHLLETFDVGAHRFMAVIGYAGSSEWRLHFLVDISENWRP